MSKKEKKKKKTERACNDPQEHYVCVCNGVCTLLALVRRCKERKASSGLNTNSQCMAARSMIPECEFLKLGMADQDGKRRLSVSVCYRVGLRGLAKRLCLAWIPRAVEIPLQPTTTPTQVKLTPHYTHLTLQKIMEPVSHTLTDH